jgi:hypothetical protein
LVLVVAVGRGVGGWWTFCCLSFFITLSLPPNLSPPLVDKNDLKPNPNFGIRLCLVDDVSISIHSNHHNYYGPYTVTHTERERERRERALQDGQFINDYYNGRL